MKNLKRLIVAVALTSVLGLAAFASETQAPPCAPPSETQSRPCTGQTSGDNSGTVSETLYLFTEAAVNMIESLLLY